MADLAVKWDKHQKKNKKWFVGIPAGPVFVGDWLREAWNIAQLTIDIDIFRVKMWTVINSQESFISCTHQLIKCKHKLDSNDQLSIFSNSNEFKFSKARAREKKLQELETHKPVRAKLARTRGFLGFSRTESKSYNNVKSPLGWVMEECTCHQRLIIGMPKKDVISGNKMNRNGTDNGSSSENDGEMHSIRQLWAQPMWEGNLNVSFLTF